MTEEYFKNRLAERIETLLEDGVWTPRVDLGVDTLRYDNKVVLIILLYSMSIDVLVDGFVVKLTDKNLVEKAKGVYAVLKKAKDEVQLHKMQERVMELIDKIVEGRRNLLDNTDKPL